MMIFKDAMEAVGIGSPPDSWESAWIGLQETGGLAIPIPTPGCISEFRENTGLDDDIVELLYDALVEASGNAAMTGLLALWKELVMNRGLWAGSWPVPTLDGRPFPLFTALVVALAFPEMIDAHRRRGIPDEVTKGNCRDLGIWMRNARATTGEWGFHELGWLTNHCRGRLYRVGRLQYIHQEYSGGPTLYRNRKTGGLMALSSPGVRYLENGLVEGTNGAVGGDTWESALLMMEGAVSGNPIDPKGYAKRDTISLNLDDWEVILSPHDPVLDIHVPEDGRLLPKECVDSMTRALTFYKGYFPELPAPRAFTCGSWLLDSQYGDILSPESNIVGFMGMFQKYPVKSDDNEAFKRAFGKRPEDPSTAPRDTGLRRAILDFTADGGRLRCAGGIIPLDGDSIMLPKE